LRYDLVGNADTIIDSVCNDECDLAMSGPTLCALPDRARYQMKIVAAIVHRAAVHGLTTNPVIENITSVKDCAGLRIAVAPRPSTAYSLIACLKKQNRRLLKNMSIIEAPIGQQIEYTRNGEADLYIDQEPYVSAAEAQGYRVIFNASEMFGPLSFTGLYGKAETLETKADAIKALCAAIAKACHIIYADAEQTDKLAAEIFKGLPTQVIKASLNRLRAECIWPKRPITSRQAWDNALGIRRATGIRFARNAWDVVDNSLIE
jgi:ABC-type nitrate/sulfonate/bicarbonate transport system substrate-binding protein